MELPTDYTKLTQPQRREVRLQYIKEQNNMCMYCGESLDEDAPKRITDKPIKRQQIYVQELILLRYLMRITVLQLKQPLYLIHQW